MIPRIKNLRLKLKGHKLDALLVSDASNIFYLSGISFFEPSEREGFLLITKNKNFIITSSLYSEVIQTNHKDFELLELSTQKSLEENLKEVAKKEKLQKVGFESNLTVAEYAKFKKIFKLTATNQVIENLRQVKDEEEIEKIKKACEITDGCFKYILKEIKVGVTEIEIQNKIKRYFEDLGYVPSFNPVVAFGPHSSMPHHVSNQTKLEKNQIVLLDFGVRYEGYCSDMTRTLFFGKADEKIKKLYETVLDSQRLAFDYLDKNVKFSEADGIARDFIIARGFPSIPHSLGHGLGIDVHDGLRLSPASKEKLQDNMVFTIEPGIYIPGFGGVRIEDDIVFSKNKLEYLTHSEKQLIEI